MPNRLAQASSPYLLQHAGNPVDWHPWGEDAFARARAEDKPILLSIGYSACHWCHVMAHESFEHPGIAAVMNAHFVNVKVDREERPDVDAVYMEAVQAMTGHGGWPLTVFLTPDGAPFYGGTYFPPAPRQGMPGFPQLMEGIAQAWRDRRPDVEQSAAELTGALRRAAAALVDRPGDPLVPDLVAYAAARLLGAFDPLEGGFGGAPKFPQPSTLAFLLARAARAGDQDLLRAVTFTLEAMARGGIWDHLGGGFHRYSVDAGWTVPHFEKMLYDNAQLARVYLEAWQLTGTPAFREIAQRTVDYLLREMRAPGGAFYATQDADTGAGEGAYFVWTPEDVRSVLPLDLADAACAWYGVTAGGNFEHGATVLSARRDEADVARELGIDIPTLAARLESARAALLAARARREAPGTDTKLVVDWNGLAIDALARAGTALDRPAWVEAAARAADFVLAAVRVAPSASGEPVLAHSWKDGRPGVPGFLEDYASLAGACVTLYEATFDVRWIEAARRLTAEMIDQFEDPRDGGFFRTGPHHEVLLVRQKELLDGAVPSGNAFAADVLLRLSALTGDGALAARAERVFRLAQPLVQRAPSAVGALLATLDNHLSGMREIAIVGPLAAGAGDLLAAVRSTYLPGAVVAYAEALDEATAAAVPLLAGRTAIGGRGTVYVCRAHVCGPPIGGVAALVVEVGASPLQA